MLDGVSLGGSGEFISPSIQLVITFEQVATTNPRIVSLKTILEKQDASPALPLPETTQDDLAVIIHTSGTSGPSKGAMLTHGNILHTIAAVAEYSTNTGLSTPGGLHNSENLSISEMVIAALSRPPPLAIVEIAGPVLDTWATLLKVPREGIRDNPAFRDIVLNMFRVIQTSTTDPSLTPETLVQGVDDETLRDVLLKLFRAVKPSLKGNLSRISFRDNEIIRDVIIVEMLEQQNNKVAPLLVLARYEKEIAGRNRLMEMARKAEHQAHIHPQH